MKKLLFTILFLSIYIIIFAQNQNENMLKYWHYRDRLNYFVIPGTKQGESEIISQRNTQGWPQFNSKWSNIGQHGVYFGYYLGMLATEYKLLTNNNKTVEAAKTLNELNLALLQFISYMDLCEQRYWGNNNTNTEDGFCVSDAMPCDFLNPNAYNGKTIDGAKHLDLLNKNLDTTNIWDATTHTYHNLPAGHPGYTDTIDAHMCDGHDFAKLPMSQDDIIGVLQGLALVKRYCPSTSTAYIESKDIACNMISYLQHCPYPAIPNPASYWQVYQPHMSGLYVEYLDQSPLAHSSGFVKASRYFKNNCVPDDPFSIIQPIWDYQALFPANKIYNNTMAATLAAIGKSWRIGITINLGCCYFNWCPNWSCLHIPFYIQATGFGIHNVEKEYNNETFYLLLYENLHKKTTKYLEQDKALAQINSAPCEGPYLYFYGGNSYHPTNDNYGGWSYSYRWRGYLREQKGQTLITGNGNTVIDTLRNSPGNFNGLDFMLFFNLYQLRYGGISYENYYDRYLSGYISSPKNLVAFNSITSSQEISGSTLPWLNYKASEQIELVPGFHATEGSSFHAHIAPVGCGENFISDSTFVAPLDTMTSEDSSTVFTIPCDSLSSYGLSDLDSVRFNGLDFDSAGTYNLHYYWDFGTTGAVMPTPATSNIINPSVFFPCNNYYKIMLIVSRDSTDSTAAIANTIEFSLYKPCCGSSNFKKSAIKPEKEQLNSYNISVFPNPTNGIINVTCSNKSIIFSIEITDLLGNIIISDEGITDSKQYNLSSKPKGIYTLKAIGIDGTVFINKVLNQ